MLNHQDAISIGIDIGGSATKMSLLHDDQVTTLRGGYHNSPSLRELAEELSDLLDDLLISSASSVTKQDIAAVGVSLAGPVNSEGVLEHASNIPAMAGLNVRHWLPNALGLDIEPLALSDALSASLCEHQCNPIPGRAIYLSLGTGVGGAVLDDGIPLVITRGTPGHFGHMDVSGGDPNAPRILGSGHGSLEAYVGANMLRDAGVPIDIPELAIDHPRMKQAIGGLARGIRIILAIYRPSHIYLMGGMSEVFEPHIDLLRELVDQNLTPAAPEDYTIDMAVSGPFAASIGAASVAQAKILRTHPANIGLTEAEIRIQQASRRKAITIE